MLFLVCPLWRPIDDETGRPPLAQSKEETNETLYFFLPFFLFVFFFSAQIALSQIVVFVYRACERKRKIRAVERRAAARGGAKKRADTK